jgi:hypothetical protein
MVDLSTVAHYIVFHPESKRYRLSVHATALVDAHRVESWAGNVWVDKPPGNEDPFVLGPSWVYSYCHATQLQRKPTPGGRYVSKGSCILFCSGDIAKRDELAVDTVFYVGEVHEWMPITEPPKRYARDVERRSDLWNFHLRFGSQPEGHSGTYTYEAALHPQADGRYSRLPVDDDGKRVSIKLSELPTELSARIKGKIRGKYPVILSGQDLREILGSVGARTNVEVIGDIVSNDRQFAALRGDGVNTCNPCGSAR